MHDNYRNFYNLPKFSTANLQVATVHYILNSSPFSQKSQKLVKFCTEVHLMQRESTLRLLDLVSFVTSKHFKFTAIFNYNLMLCITSTSPFSVNCFSNWSISALKSCVLIEREPKTWSNLVRSGRLSEKSKHRGLNSGNWDFNSLTIPWPPQPINDMNTSEAG